MMQYRAGEVRCDNVFRRLWASDGSIYEIQPLGVVRPRPSTANVVACVRYAAENHIPIHARGAGTGVAGESLGPGLVLDFATHLHRLIRAGTGPRPRSAGRGSRPAQRTVAEGGASVRAGTPPPAT